MESQLNQPPQIRSCLHTTLLGLVWAISQVTDDDRQVVAQVAHLINTGQVQLLGTFRNIRQLDIEGLPERPVHC